MVKTFRRLEDLERFKEKRETPKMRRFPLKDDAPKATLKQKELARQKRGSL